MESVMLCHSELQMDVNIQVRCPLFLTKRIRHFVDRFTSFGVNGDLALKIIM